MSKSKTMKDTQRNQRINFASARGVEVPDFLNIQMESFKEFVLVVGEGPTQHDAAQGFVGDDIGVCVERHGRPP